MGLNLENKQLIERLAEHDPAAQRVVISAWSILARQGTPPPPGNDPFLLLEHQETLPSVVPTPGGEFIVKDVTFYEKLSIGLSATALRVSIAHNDVPDEISQSEGRELNEFPRVSLVVGFKRDFQERESTYDPYFSHVYASNVLNRDVMPEAPFTVEAFEPIFYHTTARFGLYRQVQTAAERVPQTA